MLGSLRLPLYFGRYHEVFGGPYVERPGSMRGIKLAREINRPHDLSIPIKDFSVPTTDDLDRGLTEAVRLILSGQPVYAGCMGGRGRTGLFLAVLAKAFGIRGPVEYVRENYSHHAVETREQYDFVMGYAIPEAVARSIQFARLRSVFYFSKCLTQSIAK